MTGGYGAPKADDLFESFYNNGKGAKVANGSWSSAYRSYSLRCTEYDGALQKFGDVVFIASAGNDGNDSEDPMNTIGDPASCKNIIAGMYKLHYFVFVVHF